MAELIETAVVSGGLKERGFLSHGAEQQLQFQIASESWRATALCRAAGHAAPEDFRARQRRDVRQSARFLRIAWEYEPRSFPIQQGPDGAVLEASRRISTCRSTIST